MPRRRKQTAETQTEEVKEETHLQQLPIVQRAQVHVRGLKPLLMSSPQEVYEGSKGKSRKSSSEYVDEEEAEKRAYRIKPGDPKSPLVVPARCIMACLVNAARLYRTRGRVGISVKDMIKGSVSIDPDPVPLLNNKDRKVTKYIINRNLVVVQRSRILRCRPEIKEWNLKFVIQWNPRIYGLTLDQIKDVVHDAGFIGLLDWRPTFGIFELKSIGLVK